MAERKFGDKSTEYQTVFILTHENKAEQESGVIGVFNEYENLIVALHESEKADEEMGWENIYTIHQTDITD